MYLHHINWMYETEEPVKHHLEFRVFFLFVVMSFLMIVIKNIFLPSDFKGAAVLAVKRKGLV